MIRTVLWAYFYKVQRKLCWFDRECVIAERGVGLLYLEPVLRGVVVSVMGLVGFLLKGLFHQQRLHRCRKLLRNGLHHRCNRNPVVVMLFPFADPPLL